MACCAALLPQCCYLLRYTPLLPPPRPSPSKCTAERKIEEVGGAREEVATEARPGGGQSIDLHWPARAQSTGEKRPQTADR
jgi:hypothetical protein